MTTKKRQKEEKLTSLTQSCEVADELDERDYPISQLHPKMQRFIHLYITGAYTVEALAKLLDVHPNTLFKWLKREDVKEIILDMQTTTHDIVGAQLKAMSLKAMAKLNQLIDSPIDGVALQAVKDVLDRGGHKPKQEIKIDKTVKTIEQRLTELAEATLDGEFEEVED